VEVIGPQKLPEDFRGEFTVENRYDFTNLNQCSFVWQLARFPSPDEGKSGHTVLAAGRMKGPDLGPHGSGQLQLGWPANWHGADVLYLTVKDPAGRDLWTWSWRLKKAADVNNDKPKAPAEKIQMREEGGLLVVQSGLLELRFSKATGALAEVRRNGKTIPFGNGPRFVAFRRNDRKYMDVAGLNSLTRFTWRQDAADVIVEASYDGALSQVSWRISPGGVLKLDYEYKFDGVLDMLGVQFDLAETTVKGIRWLGMGPYRVWQNRMQGTHVDVWANAYNDSTPGESWIYPEFKGYFRDWQWATFDTTAGKVTVSTDSDHSFLGIYKPKDGTDGLLDLPQIGIAFLEVIPAMRNKFHTTDEIGPQSKPKEVSGGKRGTLYFRFAAP